MPMSASLSTAQKLVQGILSEVRVFVSAERSCKNIELCDAVKHSNANLLTINIHQNTTHVLVQINDNGEEAIDIISKVNADILLLDVRMSHCSGIELYDSSKNACHRFSNKLYIQ